MEKITSIRTYLLVCVALLVLTLATYLAAFVQLGSFHSFIALGIAMAKAVLIILFFMHARYSTGITRIVMIGGLVWFGILLAGTMDDYLTRGWLGIPGK